MSTKKALLLNLTKYHVYSVILTLYLKLYINTSSPMKVYNGTKI